MVLTKTQSTTAFLLGCIPLRFLLTYITYKLGLTSPVLSIESSSSATETAYILEASYSIIRTLIIVILMGIGISFLILYLKKLRLDAPEAGGITWWNNLRPIHGILYIAAGTMLLIPNLRSYAWIALIIDVILGLSSWIKHRLY